MTTGTAVVKCDVLIVGGGLSGLAAAMTAKGRGKSVLVLESRDQLGGRAETTDAPFGPIDVGAEYIGASQRYVSHFVARFGVETFPTYLPPDKKWSFQDGDGNVATFAPDELPDPATVLALGELDELAFLVRPYVDRPESLPAWLRRLDDLTIEQWQPQSGPMSRLTREAFYASLRAVLSIEPSEASFLFLLHYAATAGGYSQLIDAAGSGAGAEDRRFVHGTRALVDGFAGVVGAESIVTGEKVLHIESGARFVDVTAASKKVYRAQRVIAAVGPWAFRKRPGHNTPIELDFDFRGPDAEAERRAWNERKRLCDGTHHGLSLKCFLRFEKPFWREAGLSGRSLCVGGEGQPISWTIDNSYEPPEGASGPARQYSLMAFIAGQPAHEAARWEPDARKNAVMAQLEELFGPLPPVLAYQDHVKAGPAGVMEPGVLSTVGSALRRPVGRVHWASSESALDWCGYMDGAIQAGLRAATEVP